MHTSKLLHMSVAGLVTSLSRPKPYGCRQCMMTAFTVLLLVEHRVYRWTGSDGVLGAARVVFLTCWQGERTEGVQKL